MSSKYHLGNALPLLGLATAALMSGCASAPDVAGMPSPASGECSELLAHITIMEETKRSALEKQQGAWKAVIPFAVVARYAEGKSSAADAEKRLKELKTELARQGCGDGSGS
jgi:hypothetical protein